MLITKCGKKFIEEKFRGSRKHYPNLVGKSSEELKKEKILMKRESLQKANEINNRIVYLENRINQLDKMFDTKGPLHVAGNYQNVPIHSEEEKLHIYKYLRGEAVAEKEKLEEEFYNL